MRGAIIGILGDSGSSDARGGRLGRRGNWTEVDGRGRVPQTRRRPSTRRHHNTSSTKAGSPTLRCASAWVEICPAGELRPRPRVPPAMHTSHSRAGPTPLPASHVTSVTRTWRGARSAGALGL
jgi:hypothetical protein